MNAEEEEKKAKASSKVIRGKSYRKEPRPWLKLRPSQFISRDDDDDRCWIWERRKSSLRRLLEKKKKNGGGP